MSPTAVRELIKLQQNLPAFSNLLAESLIVERLGAQIKIRIRNEGIHRLQQAVRSVDRFIDIVEQRRQTVYFDQRIVVEYLDTVVNTDHATVTVLPAKVVE